MTAEDKQKKKRKKELPKEETVKIKKDLNLKPDFKYIVRLANTDLDGKRQVVFALTGIKGIGVRVAESLVNALNLPPTELIGNLSENDIENIDKMLQNFSKTAPGWLLNRERDPETGKNYHIFGVDLDVRQRDDINVMKMIRCYRGVRHEQGQKVRGQRTKSTGRTGLTVGVIRKAKMAAARAAAASEKEKKGKK
jgi:small subunit ribosomal protein S13